MEVAEGRLYPSVMEQTEATVIRLKLESDDRHGAYFEVGLAVQGSAEGTSDEVFTRGGFETLRR